MAFRLILGCGYVGSRVAKAWISAGDSVFGFTRSLDRIDELCEMGIKPMVWNWLGNSPPDESRNYREFASVVAAGELDTILVAISHAPVDSVPSDQTHAQGLDHLDRLLQAQTEKCTSSDISNKPKWIYLSTTGVFAPGELGSWVDETSEVAPKRPGSIAALAGEEWVAKHIPIGNRVSLRPAGIYGPDRVPRWQSIRDGEPLTVDPDSFLNLIHVDDLSQIIVQLSNRPIARPLYCVCDCEPVRRREYYEYIAKIGNWPGPVFEQAKATSVPNRGDGSKRVNHAKIVHDLGYSFLFPSYREGLLPLLGGRQP